MSELSSYGKVYGVGHKDIADLLSGGVVVEEKIDGSQFSFSFGEDGNIKTLQCRSNGQQLPLIIVESAESPVHVGTSEKMFNKAVASAALRTHAHPGWVYRCEYLQSPKHNTLAYERTPTDNLILFDVMTGAGNVSFARRESRRGRAARLGMRALLL